jgi:hypothetical protein
MPIDFARRRKLWPVITMRPATDGPAGSRWSALAVAAIFVAATLPVMSVPVFPMIDFYGHLARYFVLSRLPGDSFLAANYEAAWGILPNIGLDVLSTGLMRLFSPLLTAHVIVLLVFAAQYFGVLFLARQITGRTSLLASILAASLVYSFIFTWGFANFLLGLGLAFWAAGAWLALRHRPLLACAVGVVFATLIFFTHGVAFALYGLLVGGLEAGCLWSEGRLNPRAITRSILLLGAQAVLPVMLFAISATSKAPGGISNAGASVKRLASGGLLMHRLGELLLYRLATIWRVASTSAAWVDAIFFAAVMATLLALGLRGRVTLARRAWPAMAIGALLVLVTPPGLFGVGYVSDRMPLFLAFTAVSALVTTWRRDLFERVCVTALVCLAVARLAFIGIEWQRYRADFDDFQTAARSMTTGSLVLFANAASKDRLDPHPRCDMFGPLLIPLRGQAASLFALHSQQPIQLRGALESALDGLPPSTPPRPPYWLDDRIDAAINQRRFDYVLICDVERLGRRFSGEGNVVTRVGRFTVVRTAGAQKAS